ncbi:MAG: GGDEF domain-containing protein [Actinomycetota bacterium]
MTRTRRALSVWWAGVERHSRLKGAVLGCLGVMVLLVIALVFTIRALAAQAESDLAGIEDWSTAASHAREASVLLDTFGVATGEVRSDLIVTIDALAADVDFVDPERRSEVGRELDTMIAEVQEFIDAPEELRATYLSGLRALSQPFEDVAEELATNGRVEAADALRNLDRTFDAIQIVAVVAAVVFLAIVLTQILPLTRSIQRSMHKLRNWNDLAASESRRRTLSRQVIQGLEDAVDEPAAYAVIERAVAVAAPSHKAEMLLADSSKAHLRAAVVHPEFGAPGCSVVSPWSCPAVRRGTTQVFDDSQGIRACPHLSRRSESCSAVCAPMTFMGEPMGVLHITGAAGEVPSDELVGDVSMLASESATRVGTLRAFARAELQAATDVLTGLPNRRATEERLRTLLSTADGGAAAVLEIVGVAALNEEQGKSAGDRALKVVSEALSQSIRDDDWCGRWAGAEFVVILPGESAVGAREVVERVSAHVEEMLVAADMASLRTYIGVGDTRRARTAHGMMTVIGEALSEAREASVADGTPTAKILPGPQLSTP